VTGKLYRMAIGFRLGLRTASVPASVEYRIVCNSIAYDPAALSFLSGTLYFRFHAIVRHFPRPALREHRSPFPKRLRPKARLASEPNEFYPKRRIWTFNLALCVFRDSVGATDAFKIGKGGSDGRRNF
jgi:hypothetical protein